MFELIWLTAAEIDAIEEAVRNEIGDADEAGELAQKLSKILRQHQKPESYSNTADEAVDPCYEIYMKQFPYDVMD